MVIYLDVFPELQYGFLIAHMVACEDGWRSRLGWEQAPSPRESLNMFAAKGVKRRRAKETNHFIALFTL